ncbi:MAG: TetR family transcriptional regulator [Pseudomonadota bacterium]|nr:TetR family transcriptional regulator [Pseudomonadota bacterium]
MDDASLDRALIAALLEQAALRGWSAASIADAARDAGLPLDRVRARFPGKSAALLRFGLLADQAALGAGVPDETPRERLFDMVMRRFDSLQQHRDGILALLRHLPRDPGTALLLHMATRRSMRWLLDAAGVPAGGLSGSLRSAGLMALWLRAVHVWQGDESPDLSATMAAVDKALDQAVRAEAWLPFRDGTAAGAADAFEAGPVEDTVTDPQPGPTPDAPSSPPQIM